MIYAEPIKMYLCEHGIHQMNVKAALIDMDGVLYDSMKNHTLAWKKLADHLGIEASREEFYLYEGMTGVRTINHIYKRQFGKGVTDDEARELYKIKSAHFHDAGPVEPIAGAHDMLTTLMDSDIERVLVTGSGQVDMLQRLDVEYQGLFKPQMRITGLDVKHGKPDPEPYLMAQQRAAVKPEEAIVIENAPLGCEAGNKSGSLVIGITTGPMPRQALLDGGAHLVFDSMEAFAKALPLLIETLKTVNI